MKHFKSIAAIACATVFGIASLSASAGKYYKYGKSDEITHAHVDSMLDGSKVDAVSTITRHKDNYAIDFTARELTPGNAYTLWIMGWDKPRKCENPCVCVASDWGNEEIEPTIMGGTTGRVADEYGQLDLSTVLEYGELPTGDNQVLWGGPIKNRRAQITLVLRDHGPASEDPEVLEAQLSSHGGGCDVNSCVDVVVSRHPPAYCKAPK